LATIAREALPSWASTQGMQGLVTTALCPASADGGLYVTAYGWSGDSSQYDVSVLNTELDGLEAQVSSMASSGYFITALGRDGTGVDGNGGYILVGTKPVGSTVARTTFVVRTSRISAALNQFFSDGWAVVGYIFDDRQGYSDAGNWLLIGER